jgi:peptidylprolyl isomerase
MAQAKKGDTVKVHYKGTLTDGTEFDNSAQREPIEFALGSGTLIPGFEKAVEGMAPGESKTFTISVDEAYGPRREELIMTIPRDQIPPDLNPSFGEHLVLEREGQEIRVVVVESNEEGVQLDANHPLAGEDLVFEINLLEIV